MSNGKLVLLTGPAAAGKSTLAKGLQAQLGRDGELWLILELDTFARGLPRRWLSWGEHHGRYAEKGFVYARGVDGALALELGPDGRRVLAAFHRSVAAVVTAGVNVICETIVYDDDDWRDWSQALTGIAASWIRLSAPVSVLEGRERAERPDVSQGLARGMSERRVAGRYDLEVDTGAEPVEMIVQRLVGTLA